MLRRLVLCLALIGAAGVASAQPVYTPPSGSGATNTYSLQAGFANLAAPADATTYYFGAPSRSTTGPTRQTAMVPIPATGTLSAVYIRVMNVGTAGSNETSALSFRLNDTTDTAITSSLATNVSGVGYSATGLSVAVTAGDFFELKWVSPTWATNPTNIYFAATLYFTTS